MYYPCWPWWHLGNFEAVRVFELLLAKHASPYQWRRDAGAQQPCGPLRARLWSGEIPRAFVSGQ